MIDRFEQPTCLEYTVTAGPTTQRFLEGVLEGKLMGRRCGGCDKVYVPPRGACPTCAVPLGEEVEVSQEGVVTTFAIVAFPFEGQILEPPYACAHVLLDGADVPVLHIVGGCPVEAVRMGLRVRAVWDDEARPTLGRVLYFEPVP